MVGAFLRTFFEGLDIKCSLAAYALLNDRDGEGYGMEKKRLPVRPIVLGLATAMGAYLVLLTLTAYLTVSGRLDEARIGQTAWACACLAAFGGAMIASREKRGAAVLPLLGVLGVRVADWTARVGHAGHEWNAEIARGVCAWWVACGGTCAAGEGKTGKAT